MDTTYADVKGLYAAAQSAQYGRKNLREALEIYRSIASTHPESQEAGYSRSQIETIVKRVVPELEILKVKVSLALTYLQRSDGSEPVDLEACS